MKSREREAYLPGSGNTEDSSNNGSGLSGFPLCFPFFPFQIVFVKKAFGLCFRIPLLWTKTMMVRVLVLRVGWTQAFSGSRPCSLFRSSLFFLFPSVFCFFLISPCARLPLPSFYKARDSPGGGNGRPPKCSVTDAFNEETYALAANG